MCNNFSQILYLRWVWPQRMLEKSLFFKRQFRKKYGGRKTANESAAFSAKADRHPELMYTIAAILVVLPASLSLSAGTETRAYHHQERCNRIHQFRVPTFYNIFLSNILSTRVEFCGSARHAQASAWAGLVGFAQEEGTRLVRGPADTPTSTSVWFCFQSRDSNI